MKKCVPATLTLSASGILLYDTFTQKDIDKSDNFIRKGLPLFGSIFSALAAPFITSKIFKTAPKSQSLKEIQINNKQNIKKFLDKNLVDEKTLNILKKSEEKILKYSEVKYLSKNLKTEEGENLLKNLIPEPENISSKDIFSEIGRLSIFGLIPVIGGIIGGIAGDKIIDGDKYKEKIPNKIKEGAYQYLANIFLCNIGAGVALGIMEKMHIRSKSARALGMVTGIVTTGVIGGSAIANYISKNFIDKIFKEHAQKTNRKPEVLDICLHSDDIATVAVMSGLKWIEPLLPILYSISGYRAGIGYRNNTEK